VGKPLRIDPTSEPTCRHTHRRKITNAETATSHLPSSLTSTSTTTLPASRSKFLATLQTAAFELTPTGDIPKQYPATVFISRFGMLKSVKGVQSFFEKSLLNFEY
jgi:hypothetical protein